MERRVTATKLATGLTYETVSNSRREFAITLLPAGRYRIRVEATGFKTWNIAEATLDVGDRFRADAKMEVGGLEQSIHVTAEAGALQTESATWAPSLIRTRCRTCRSTPNFIQLAKIVPGANNYDGGSFANGGLDDRRRGTTVSVNGGTGAENNFTIEWHG